jgi:hypothetical protein
MYGQTVQYVGAEDPSAKQGVFEFYIDQHGRALSLMQQIRDLTGFFWGGQLKKTSVIGPTFNFIVYAGDVDKAHATFGYQYKNAQIIGIDPVNFNKSDSQSDLMSVRIAMCWDYILPLPDKGLFGEKTKSPEIGNDSEKGKVNWDKMNWSVGKAVHPISDLLEV